MCWSNNSNSKRGKFSRRNCRLYRGSSKDISMQSSHSWIHGQRCKRPFNRWPQCMGHKESLACFRTELCRALITTVRNHYSFYLRKYFRPFPGLVFMISIRTKHVQVHSKRSLIPTLTTRICQYQQYPKLHTYWRKWSKKPSVPRHQECFLICQSLTLPSFKVWNSRHGNLKNKET